MGVACLLLALAGCQTPCLPCISGKMRTTPVYVDPEGYRSLSIQIDNLNHRFSPYQTAMDRLHFPRRICKWLVQIDNDLQHANAVLISREVAPEKIQWQVDRIERNLNKVEAEFGGVFPPLERCCKGWNMQGGSYPTPRPRYKAPAL